MADLKFFKPLSDLKEWEDNYNSGDVEGIARSIRRFGFNGALRVWGSSTVMAGNHSLKALRLIKEQGPDSEQDHAYPPTNIVVDGDEWYVPFIDVSHLDPLEAKAWAIADNTIARKAVTDDVLLTKYLKEVADHDQLMILATGYNAEQVSAMVQALQTTFTPIPMIDQPRLDQIGKYCEVCRKRLYDG